jgi:class 3 adenylate cyclase
MTTTLVRRTDLSTTLLPRRHVQDMSEPTDCSGISAKSPKRHPESETDPAQECRDYRVQMAAPETRYAKKGEISIAYQVVGDGPIDLVVSSGIVSHMALMWSDPEANAMWRRMASFSRLVLFDKPGTGLSDPIAGPPTMEQRVEDIRVVMDAVGSRSAALLGYSEGGAPSLLFAATYPERCDALILLETGPKWTSSPDYLPELRERLDRTWERIFEAAEHWGEGLMIGALFAPSATTIPGSMQVFGSAERICASPGMVRALAKANMIVDVRAALPRITTPTLVLQREESVIPVEFGRYMTETIAGSRLAVFPGRDHLPWVGRWEPIVDEVEQFLTGARHRADPDRALATIMFTDIVASTERTAELGDARWRSLVELHDDLVGTEIERYGGRSVKTMGDGFLAVFEGPAKAVRCARATGSAVRSLGIEVRAGVHTGECERRGDDLSGIAVNVAARIVAKAGPNEVLVSSTVRELVLGSGLEFSDRGAHLLKGVPDEWRLFAVTGDGRTDAHAVAEVDPEVAALTPGPRETLRPRDRAMLAAATRAPGLLRTISRPLLHPRRRRDQTA